MNSPILEQLREQTRSAHLALEAQPLLKGLLSSQLAATEYGQLLQSMLAFYQPLESKLVPATAALLGRHPNPDYQYLPRAPLLIDDCRVLGIDAPELIDIPAKFQLEGSAAYMLGVLYVIEGSTQGGRYIANHLAHTLGVGERSGASFFNIHQESNSWTAFRLWLTRDLTSHFQNDIKSIIEGAEMTFTALRVHLDQWQLPSHGK